MKKLCSVCESKFEYINGKGMICDKCRLLRNIDKKKNGCWEWQAGKFKRGYGQFYYNGKRDMAHRVSYLLFKGKISSGQQVNHFCDNPSCINPDHLWLGTQLDNMRDMIKKNRHIPRIGEENEQSKLTNDDIYAIRKMRKIFKTPYKKIGSYFGVCKQTISEILNKKRWRHI